MHSKLGNDRPGLLLCFQTLYRVPAGILLVHRVGHDSVHIVTAGGLIAVDSGEAAEVEEEKRSPGEPL